MASMAPSASSSSVNVRGRNPRRFSAPLSLPWVNSRNDITLKTPTACACSAYSGHRSSFAKSLQRTMTSRSAASRHGPAPVCCCTWSSSRATGRVALIDSKVPPLIINTSAQSTRSMSETAVAVSSARLEPIGLPSLPAPCQRAHRVNDQLVVAMTHRSPFSSANVNIE